VAVNKAIWLKVSKHQGVLWAKTLVQYVG